MKRSRDPDRPQETEHGHKKLGIEKRLLTKQNRKRTEKEGNLQQD